MGLQVQPGLFGALKKTKESGPGELAESLLGYPPGYCNPKSEKSTMERVA